MVTAFRAGSTHATVVNFSSYSAGSERKQAFFEYFVPIIEQENESIRKERMFVTQASLKADSLSWFAKRKVNKIANKYRVEPFDYASAKDWTALLDRVDEIPPALALAQAANESAWGTSRFAVEAKNYFGQWCFSKGCGLVPKARDAGKAHEVAVFDTPAESVASYMRNLNRHSSYSTLREIRLKYRDGNMPLTGEALAQGLVKYSERGPAYVEELISMIRFNKLEQYALKTRS